MHVRGSEFEREIAEFVSQYDNEAYSCLNRHFYFQTEDGCIIPDVYSKKYSLIIEAYGDYRHANPHVYEASKVFHNGFTMQQIFEKDETRREETEVYQRLVEVQINRCVGTRLEIKSLRLRTKDSGVHEMIHSCLSTNKTITSHNSDLSDRDTLVKSLRTSYGDENVYPILNINTLQLKSLVKDISKMHGIPFEEVNEATKRLDEDVRHKAMPEGENKSLFMLKYDDCMQYSEPFRKFITAHPEVGDHVKVLYRQPRGLGKHAGGVIVTQDASKHMPLIAAGGEMRTPWVEGMNRKDLEVYGLIKFDLLGLETLRIIENCARLILKRHEGVSNPTWEQVRAWIDKTLDPETMDLDDQRVYENVFISGKFAGTFQFTAKHTQKFIKALQPRSIGDLSVATSIYRPGPLAAKVDKLYIERKRKAEAGEVFEYDHPAIEKVLGRTYGYLVFQEQLMHLAAELAGFNPDECDKLRKVILKRSVQAQAGQKGEVQKLEDKFIDGAVANGLKREKAIALFEEIAAMCSYAFNESHAVCYSIDSYHCAWLLTYYEAEWLCAYAETMIGNKENREIMMAEVKSLGYTIGNVDINHSYPEWTIDDANKKLIPSFKTVTGIGDAAIEEIMENRPYRDLRDLLWNGTEWRHAKMNKRVLDALIRIGGLDSLGMVGKGKLFEHARHLHEIVIGNYDLLRKRDGFNTLIMLIASEPVPQDWSQQEKLEMQRSLVGNVNVDELVSPSMVAKLSEKGIPSIDELEIGEKQISWFLVAGAEVKKTKTGKNYLKISAYGSTSTARTIMCWGYKSDSPPAAGGLWLAEVERNEGGWSTVSWRMRSITQTSP